MSGAEPAEEFELLVPDDPEELVAELKRRGLIPGARLHARVEAPEGNGSNGGSSDDPLSANAQDGAATASLAASLPPELAAIVGSLRSGRSDGLSDER